MIGTTTIFAMGSFVIPTAIHLASLSENYVSGGNLLIYFYVFSYSVTILFSFVYPAHITHKTAQKARNNKLEEIRKTYYELKHNLDVHIQKNTITETYLLELDILRNKLQTIREEYADYKNMHLYPFGVNILMQLITSVMLPIIFLSIQSLINKI